MITTQTSSLYLRLELFFLDSGRNVKANVTFDIKVF